MPSLPWLQERLGQVVSSSVHVAWASFPSPLLFLGFLESLLYKLFALKSLTRGRTGGCQIKIVASVGVWTQIPFLGPRTWASDLSSFCLLAGKTGIMTDPTS